MAGDQDRQGEVTIAEAKRRLVEDAPAPMDVLARDPADLIRRHPREAVAIAAALGVLISASPRVRRGLIDVIVGAVKLLR